MFISRIQLNRHRRDAWRLLSSPQRMHAAVLASFLDPPTGERPGEPRVLWRLDNDRERTFLYVVSPDEPDLTHIAEQAGYPRLDLGLVKPYDSFLDRVAVGQRWAFRLTANPTRYVRSADGGKARRLGHVTVAFQEEWLTQRCADNGFVLHTLTLPGVDGDVTDPAVRVSERSVDQFTRGRQDANVTLTRVRYDGVLDVVDVDALRRALTTGIGPAKAYGCGLLTLAASS